MMLRPNPSVLGRLPSICALTAVWIFQYSLCDLPAQEPSAATSIVRVNVTSQRYNVFRPWEKDAPGSRRGLGAVLDNNQVLVTAELVADATYIELELPDSGEKTTARVAGVDYEADLALLTPVPADSTFLAGRVPLKIAGEVKEGDTLEVWQLEDNGTPIVTKGEIINVEVSTYFLDSSYFLTYQLKGSLQYRSGSFTLPVVKNGELAGLLLSYSSDEQISRILAAPIIRHFLEEMRRDPDSYPGFPNLGISYAQTLDDQLRGYLGLTQDQGGVFITRVIRDSSADQAGLQEGDVLLELDGHPIDSRGNYEDPLHGRINLSHIVRGNASVGDQVLMKILRDGKVETITAALSRKEPEEFLVDPYRFDRGPKFLILGGLIFQELTKPYLEAWGDKWRTQAPFKLVYADAFQDELEKEGRDKLVFLSRVFRTPTTLGYETLSHLTVTKVNGKDINNLHDLDAALKEPVDGVHEIEFTEYPRVIFIDAAEAEETNRQLKDLGIAQIKRLE